MTSCKRIVLNTSSTASTTLIPFSAFHIPPTTPPPIGSLVATVGYGDAFHATNIQSDPDKSEIDPLGAVAFVAPKKGTLNDLHIAAVISPVLSFDAESEVAIYVSCPPDSLIEEADVAFQYKKTALVLTTTLKSNFGHVEDSIHLSSPVPVSKGSVVSVVINPITEKAQTSFLRVNGGLMYTQS